MMGQSYREDCNEAKAARAGIVDQRPPPNRSRKAKPIVVEYRLSEIARTTSKGNFWTIFGTEWSKWHSYRTTAEAEKAIADQQRKHPDLWEFRLKP
jgi:hypothetical protein